VVALTVERSELADSLTEALEARVALIATEPPEPDAGSRTRAPSAARARAQRPDLAQPRGTASPSVSRVGTGRINTGNGYYGGLQFNIDSWRWVGGSGYPHEASKAEQIRRAEILHQRQGWNAWPVVQPASSACADGRALSDRSSRPDSAC
jgi:hypothetical protein